MALGTHRRRTYATRGRTGDRRPRGPSELRKSEELGAAGVRGYPLGSLIMHPQSHFVTGYLTVMDPGPTTPTTIEFGPLRISYDDRVLCPRPWTLEQSRWAAELARQAPEGALLELCCGAGQIGLATIAAVRRRLVCVDVDPVACEYTRLNADLSGLGGLLEVRTGPLQDRFRPEERFAGVIADPPWVPHDDIGLFPEDPVTAIDGGPDGLDLARACLGVAADHLMPGGFAVLQVGNVLQVDRLATELDKYDGRLDVREMREFDGGVLVRLERA